MFTVPDMFDELSAVFDTEIARGVLTVQSDPATFNVSRNSAMPELLDTSFWEIVQYLGGKGIALPREIKPGANGELVNFAQGHGFTKGPENKNSSGLVQVTSQRGLVLPMTWADAPAFIALYFDPANPHVRVIAAGSGIWHKLPDGTVRKTVAFIRKEVERLGGTFNIEHLWVSTSPGARAHGNWPFRLDDEGRNKVLRGDGAPYAGCLKLLADPQPEPWRGDKPLRRYALDLSGITARLWVAEGVLPEHLFFDRRPNASVSSANKRAADANGQMSWVSEALAICLA